VTVCIPGVLDASELEELNDRLRAAAWTDGRLTAGFQSAQVKGNMQLPETDPLARELSERVLAALERQPLFVSAALPRHVFPPVFNCYRTSMSFGAHVDNAIRQLPGMHFRLRTDLSATLFLSGPEEYDGGELVIEDTYGPHRVKLPAGDLILYPAGSLHRVEPVTRGARLGAVFWVQSMVRDDAGRTLLFELDHAIRTLTTQGAHRDSIVQLTSCYHNLLRQWAEV
jgi:PKHD-type hydroxylase